MADVKIRIEVNPNAESETIGDIVNENAEISNVSVKTGIDYVFQDIPTSNTAISGSNGILMNDDLVFDSNDYLDNSNLTESYLESEQNPKEFVWGIVPENKEYSVKLTFTNASSLKDIVVYGDSVVDQFPTRAIIDDETVIFSDDNKWAIDLLSESDTHTIEFTHWNRANYNACLTLIRVMFKYFEINKQNGLKNVESLYQTTPDAGEITYQTIPNQGFVTIVNDELKEFVNDNIIEKDETNIEILIGNNIVRKHNIETLNVEKFKKEIKIQLTNRIRNFEKYVVSNKLFTGYGFTLYDILGNALYEASLLGVDFYTTKQEDPETGDIIYPEFDNMCDSVVEYNGSFITVKEYLKNFYYNFPYEEQNLLTFINKILEATQLNCYMNEKNEIKFVSARPVFSDKFEKDCIIIPSKNQFSDISADVIKNNIIKNVSIRKFSDTTKEISSNEGIQQTSEHSENVIFSTESIDSQRLLSYSDIYDLDMPGNSWVVYKTKTGVINPLKNNAYVSIPTAEPYCIAECLDYSGNTEFYSRILDSYNSYDEFLDMVSNFVGDAGIGFIGGYCTKYNNKVLPYFTPHTEYFFAFNMQGNYIKYKTKFYFGSSQELKTFTEDEKETIYGDDLNFGKKSSISFSGNEFLNTTSVDNFASTLLGDYKDGIMTAKVTVSCSDYFDVNGVKVIDWSKNETLKVGNIVRLDNNFNGSSFTYSNGSPIFWKITSTNFRYSGVPLLDLELQETKDASLHQTNVIINNFSGMIIETTPSGEDIRIESSKTVSPDSTLFIRKRTDREIQESDGLAYYAYDLYINQKWKNDGTYPVSQLVDKNNNINIETKEYRKIGSSPRLDLPYVTVSSVSGENRYTINHSNSNVSIIRISLDSENYSKIIETYSPGQVFYTGTSTDNTTFYFVAIDNSGEFASSGIFSYEIPNT